MSLVRQIFEALVMLELISMLAVFRLTYMLQNESGPWDLVGKLRERISMTKLRELYFCFLCLSVWIAIIPALLLSHGNIILWLIHTLGISAGAIITNEIHNKLNKE